jgi:ferrochelatase
VHVALGMSYGSPGVDGALASLYARRVRRLVVLPLYPQYSGSTTGSVFDAVTRALSRRRWVPELRFINHYHDAAGYIAALAADIRGFREEHGSGERLLFSFHGLPRSMLDAGDPYHCQCQKTARLVAEALELADGDWHIAFQSRLGRAEWLRPYCDETLIEWGTEKLGTVDVVCPGFAVDCLETLEEIAMQNAELYTAAGGGELRYIPALNASDEHVAFLSRLVEKNVAGWPEASLDRSETAVAGERARSRRRALDLGAGR